MSERNRKIAAKELRVAITSYADKDYADDMVATFFYIIGYMAGDDEGITIQIDRIRARRDQKQNRPGDAATPTGPDHRAPGVAQQ